MYLKGRVLEKLGREGEAEQCFQEALDINPQFSQVAFYLAAIENKRGNFEKSIDLYNYALSKDQIPSAGYKTSTPFVSIDIGVASDNTIKANIAGKKQQLESNLKPIPDIKGKLEERDKSMNNPSDISTNVPSLLKTIKKKRCKRISHPKPDILKSNQKQRFSPKNQMGIFTVENSPDIDKKKLRKAWRMGKNGK